MRPAKCTQEIWFDSACWSSPMQRRLRMLDTLWLAASAVPECSQPTVRSRSACNADKMRTTSRYRTLCYEQQWTTTTGSNMTYSLSSRMHTPSALDRDSCSRSVVRSVTSVRGCAAICAPSVRRTGGGRAACCLIKSLGRGGGKSLERSPHGPFPARLDH